MPEPPAPARRPPPPLPGGRLAAEAFGDGPPVVLAHGFTQTGHLWGGLDTLLAADHRVTAVDLPGHAGSAAVRADVRQGADCMVATGMVATGGPGTYVGYSMGARFCLHAALAHPGQVERLVLISGTAGIDDPLERAERRRADEALADRLDPPDGSAGIAVGDFVRHWLAGPLFDGIPEAAAGVAERLRNTGEGLASSLRLAGTATEPPSWERLGTLTMPVLVITGRYDDKFTGLGRRMALAIGANATHVVVPASGHAPHLQQPGTVASLIHRHVGRSP